MFFFFNDTATTEIYTLSLHDALPICEVRRIGRPRDVPRFARRCCETRVDPPSGSRIREEGHRSEEHTSELQSHSDLVCRLLLEKKKKKKKKTRRINNTTDTNTKIHTR